MFDSVLNQRKVARQRALGSTISVVVHAAIIGAIIWYSTHKPKVEEQKGVPVAFLTAPKAAPTAAAPPPPPPPKKHKPKTPVIKHDLVIPKDVPKEKPPEKPPEDTKPDDSDDSDDTDDGVEGGVEGGVKGGVVGGVVGGVLGNPLPSGDDPVFFGEGMTKPAQDVENSESFHWNRAQLDAHVEGLCLVQCVITKEGALKDCKILKRIPQVDDAQIMDYLAHLKFHPAMQGGKPISLKGFTIPLRLKVP